MSRIECPECTFLNEEGAKVCAHCKMDLPSPEVSTPEPAQQPSAEEPETPEPAEAPPAPPVREAPQAPLEVKPPSPQPLAPSATAPPAGTPSIADLVPCPNPGCFGVVAPGDAYCTFCGARLPAAPAATAPPPDLPPSPAGVQPAGGGFHIPRGVWIVLSIIPLALCGLIAAVVLNATGAPLGMFDPGALPDVQKDAERIAWPSGTPTRAPTVTPTATRTATPTTTGTRGTGPAPGGPTARVGTPTMTPDPNWKPAPLTLGKGAPTVPVTADNLFTGVTVYYFDSTGTNSFVYEVMGRADNCRSMKSGRAIMLRRYDGIPYWVDSDTLVNYLTKPSEHPSVIRTDDPGLKARQWVSYPCPQ